jgi:hypothetical protein
MKTFGSLVFAVACVAALALSAGAARAQNTPGKYIGEASTRLAKMIDNASGTGYKIRGNAFFMGGALLQQSKDNWIPLGTVELDQDRPYVFLAAGDADATDVDIQILGPNGDVVAKDDSTNVEATVEYRPTTRGRYTIRMRLYASQNSVSCYCFAAMLCK